MYKILMQIAEGHGIILIFKLIVTSHAVISAFIVSFTAQPSYVTAEPPPSPSISLSPLSTCLPPSLHPSFHPSLCVHSSVCLCIFFYVNIQVLRCMCALVSVLLSHLICILISFPFRQ